MTQGILFAEPKTTNQQKQLTISVIGLGKVGLTLASCLANAGHRVIGVDVNHSIVSALNERRMQSGEPGVTERIQRSSDRLHATTDIHEAVLKSEISFLIVPTPSNTFGGFSLKFVLEACQALGLGMRTKEESHTVSLVSTVLPGSCEQMIIPTLEQFSGKKMGHGLGFCYNPSFIALGEVVRGIEKPNYILIGETDPKYGDLVLAAHHLMVPEQTPVVRMELIEAEITKLASNTYETMRVSFANMLMAACSEIPNANVDRITAALSLRMNARFFKGATPFGGPCWPRDNKALSLFLDSIGVLSQIPYSVDLFNEEHSVYILRKVLEVSRCDEKIGVLGLAYKSGTPIIERSFSIELIRGLIQERRKVVAWDPMALLETQKIFGDQISYVKSCHECLEQASILVITNPFKEMETVSWSIAKNKTVIDCWRCLQATHIEEIGHYLPLGKGKASSSLEDKNFKKRLQLLTN